jgi:hypothetical protein
VDHVKTLDSRALTDHLTASGLRDDVDHILAAVPVPLPLRASAAAQPAEAETGWWPIFGFLNQPHLRGEVKMAEADAARNLNPDTQRHVVALNEALNKVMAGEPDGGLAA